MGSGSYQSVVFSVMASAAAPPPLETTNFTIPSVDPGIELFMRNKHPAGMTAFSPERTVLFIRRRDGYPAETAFDLPIEGVSMMDLIAEQGYDVFLVDVRGYGGSTRVPEMREPGDANKPLSTSADAAKDLGAAVDHILKIRNIAKLDLIGWSWGTSISGSYTSQNNDKINRLVLYAPAWLFQPPVAPTDAPLPAWRQVTKEFRPGALAERRARGQAGDADFGGRVRPLVGGDVGVRSDRQPVEPARGARAQRRIRRVHPLLAGRQTLLRSRQDHRADAVDPRRIGTRTCRAIRHRPISSN